MSSDSRPNQTINISGAGSNNQFGDGNTQNIQQTFGGELTADRVIDQLAEAVPEEAQAEMEEQVFGPLRAELQTLAAMPIAESEQVKPTVIERVKTYIAALAPYSERLNKVALSVGEAALTSIAPPAGWFVSSVLAGIRAMRE